MTFSKLKYIFLLIAIFFVCAAPSMTSYDEVTEAPSETDYFIYYVPNGTSYTMKRMTFLHMMELLETSLTNFEIHADNVAGGSGPSTTVTITDNESTNETNPIVFVPGGDLDGGDFALESDGDLNYNPSSGTLSGANCAFTSAVFDDVNDSIHLEWNTTLSDWVVTGYAGITYTP